MNLSEVSEKINSINVPLYTLIIVGAVSISLMIFLSFVVVRLFKKVKDLSKVRYGFGGKPIFSFFIIIITIIAIPLTYYASQNSIETIKLANAEKDVVVKFYKEKKTKSIYSVSFMAIPTINGEYWRDKEYEIKWKVTGDLSFEKVETQRSIENPSYFTKELPKGVYDVEVFVESEKFKVVKTKDLVIN